MSVNPYCFNMRNTLSRPRTEKRKRQTQKERWIQEKEQTKGEKRQAPSEGGGAAGPEQEEPVVKSGACCHVLTCPSVVILGELRLFVDHHTSDGHVRVLLFGLLYSLGQRLSPPTVNQHKQTKANKRFKGKNEQPNTRMKTQATERKRMMGNIHACEEVMLGSAWTALSLRGWQMSCRYGNLCARSRPIRSCVHECVTRHRRTEIPHG